MRADPLVATLAAVSALAVIDGDTIRIGASERRLGELTKRRLEALAGAGQVDLRADRPGQRDRYGRLLVRLFVNGEDAACVLIREGYARPWRGRREDWCVKIDPPESMAGIVCAVSLPAAPPASPD
jgi:endonuclease YncB( thermonuclease family)